MALRIRLGEYYDIVRGQGPGYRELIGEIFFPKLNDIYGSAISIKVGHAIVKLGVEIDSCQRNGKGFSGRLRRIVWREEVLWDPVPNSSDRGTSLDFEVSGYSPDERSGGLMLHNLSVRRGYSRPELFTG